MSNVKYLNIANDIREKIKDGTYAVGQRLPGLEKLKEEHDASLMTVRRAQEILQREGLLRVTQGEGAFVVMRPGVFNSDAERSSVVERLRGTKRAEEDEQRADGRQEGKAWAKGFATAGELEEIANYALEDTIRQDHSLVQFLSDRRGYFISSADIDFADPYWDGFVAGATEVWDAVRDSL